jgi:hypothetical protein
VPPSLEQCKVTTHTHASALLPPQGPPKLETQGSHVPPKSPAPVHCNPVMHVQGLLVLPPQRPPSPETQPPPELDPEPLLLLPDPEPLLPPELDPDPDPEPLLLPEPDPELVELLPELDPLPELLPPDPDPDPELPAPELVLPDVDPDPDPELDPDPPPLLASPLSTDDSLPPQATRKANRIADARPPRRALLVSKRKVMPHECPPFLASVTESSATPKARPSTNLPDLRVTS